MKIDRSYILPSAYSIVLHAALIALLFLHWETKLDILKPKHNIVASVQVSASDIKKINDQIAKPPKPVEKPPEPIKPKPPEPDAISVATDVPKPTVQPTIKPAPTAIPTQKPKPNKAQIDDLLSEAKQETKDKKPVKKPAPPTDQVANAQSGPNVIGDPEGDDDVAAIAAKVQENWSRPSSYRKGMKVLFETDLLPTGEVVDVRIKEGSGDVGFDRSAEAAIRKASPLPVPKDPQRFDQYFRRLQFWFTPDQF